MIAPSPVKVPIKGDTVTSVARRSAGHALLIVAGTRIGFTLRTVRNALTAECAGVYIAEKLGERRLALLELLWRWRSAP